MGLCMTHKKGDKVFILSEDLSLEIIVSGIHNIGDRKEVELRVKTGEGDEERIETYALNYFGAEARITENVLVGLYTSPSGVDYHVGSNGVSLTYTAPRKYLILREKLYDKIMLERKLSHEKNL